MAFHMQLAPTNTPPSSCSLAISCSVGGSRLPRRIMFREAFSRQTHGCIDQLLTVDARGRFVRSLGISARGAMRQVLNMFAIYRHGLPRHAESTSVESSSPQMSGIF